MSDGECSIELSQILHQSNNTDFSHIQDLHNCHKNLVGAVLQGDYCAYNQAKLQYPTKKICQLRKS